MSRELPPCDHDECPPTHCKRSGSFAAPLCYAAGERVMAKHARWGWIPATVRWQNITTVAVITDHNYLVTIPLEDVKPHNAPHELPPTKTP